MQLTWLAWDGRMLRWRIEADVAQSTEVELCVDGVVFERMTVAGTEYQRDFPISPSGNAQMEVCIRDGTGRAVGSPWRIRHGHPANAAADAWHGAASPMRALVPALPPVDWRMPDVAVVVPIFNSPQLVQLCIEAVRRWTPAARLILIDDASTDAGVAALLEHYAGAAGVTVLRNAQNLGYTRSCNIGIEHARGADVVLLNSDTEVGPRWLQSLAQAAYAESSLGTATAVSDNAGAFSVPELERYCPIPERWTLVQAQRALLQHTGGCRPELPTGNGFCMYIKRAAIERIGALDAEAFPAGYGEENDFCQRAEQAGFRHVIAGDVLVRHARSASFGAERRQALGIEGMAVLRRRYPDYEQKIGATLFSFARRVLDYRVRRIYADVDGFYAAQPPRPRTLFVGDAAAQSDARFDCFAWAGEGLCRHGERIELDTSDLRAVLARLAIEAVVGSADTRLNTAAASLGIPVFAHVGDAALVALVDADP